MVSFRPQQLIRRLRIQPVHTHLSPLPSTLTCTRFNTTPSSQSSSLSASTSSSPLAHKSLPERLWKAPLPTTGSPLAYQVRRTQPFNTLPVYSKIRPGSGQIWTLVKKIDGDIKKLKGDLMLDFPNAEPIMKLRIRQILMRGKITKEVKLWLQDRGF